MRLFRPLCAGGAPRTFAKYRAFVTDLYQSFQFQPSETLALYESKDGTVQKRRQQTVPREYPLHMTPQTTITFHGSTEVIREAFGHSPADCQIDIFSRLNDMIDELEILQMFFQKPPIAFRCYANIAHPPSVVESSNCLQSHRLVFSVLNLRRRR